MGVGSKGGGGDGGDGESVRDWRAEEAVAGNREALDALRELVTYPFLYARQSCLLGLKWPRGLLLYGPPGTGKTSLVQAVVRECNAHLTIINPYSVHKAHAGEGEKFLLKLSLKHILRHHRVDQPLFSSMNWTDRVPHCWSAAHPDGWKQEIIQEASSCSCCCIN